MRSGITWLSVVFAIALGPVARAEPCTVDVAPTGGPINTISQAQAAVQALLRSGTCTPTNGTLVQVNLRSAVYPLGSNPLQLGAADSGQISAPVVWRTDPQDDQPAVISAGKAVIGWKIGQWNGMVSATAQVDPSSTVPFAQLYTSGSWRQIARHPNIMPDDEGSRGFSGTSTLFWSAPLQPCRGSAGCPQGNHYGFQYTGDDFDPTWHDLHNVSVIAFQSWTAFRARIAAVIPANRTVLFSSPLNEPIGQYPTQGGRRIVVENLREGLDTPGEWYWDAASGGNLTYLLTADEAARVQGGEAVDDVLQAVVPQIDAAVEFEGAAHVTLSRLSVQHARDGGAVNRERSYYVETGAVLVGASENIRLEGVSVTLCGASGIIVSGNASGFVADRVAVQTVGGEGFSISVNAQGAQDVLITDSVFNDTGRVFMAQTGVVRLRGKRNVTLQYSEAGYGPYAGVMLGWQQGVPTPPYGDTIEPVFFVRHNHIHDYGMGILSDFGGVYVSSNDNTCWLKDECAVPTLVEANWISGGRHYDYGSEGTYADEQAAAINITGNLITDMGDACIFHHCGEAQYDSNNILSGCGMEPKGSYLKACNSGGNPTWPNLTHGFDFHRNIIFIDESANLSPLTSDTDFRATHFDYNVYWQQGGGRSELEFPDKLSWSQWQATGNDTHSAIADPLFADAASGNYTLLPGSPALAMGFAQINQSAFGPRPA